MSKYSQIFSDIAADIDHQRYQLGDSIPSESALMSVYRASRGTVRKAVDLLQERGYVQKIHGKGVFVLRSGSIGLRLDGLVSFAEMDWATTLATVSSVVEMEMIAATGVLAQTLAVAAKTPLVRIKRVRCIDGANAILDINHFVASLVPGLTREIAAGSIYRYIEQELGLNISYARRIIQVCPCDEDDRRYLDLHGMDHVVVVKSLAHLYDGRMFEVTESHHCQDRFLFSYIARR